MGLFSWLFGRYSVRRTGERLGGGRGGEPPASRTRAAGKTSNEDRIFLEAPGLDRKRAALLQLNAGRLRVMIETLPPGKDNTLALDLGAGLEKFSFVRSDLEWAARVASVLDQADALGNQKRFQEAIGAYKEGLRSAPGFPILLMSLGVCYFRIGDRTKGLRYLERACELDPDNARIRKNFESARDA